MRNLPQRLTPKAETIRFLLLRSGNECAFPGCAKPIFNNQNVLVAECCHIEAAMPGGARYNPFLTDEERRSYDNLLFMCHEHHIETDDTAKYPTEILQQIKKGHEVRFQEKKIIIEPDYISQVLAAFHNIKESTTETLEISKRLEKKQDELIEYLKIQQPQHQTNQQNIDIPIPSVPEFSNFFGRETEIKELRDALSKFTLIEIGGISGIGKSTLIAKIFSKDPNCLWIEVIYVSNVQELLVIINAFLIKVHGDKSVDEILTKGSDIEKSVLAAIAVIEKHKSKVILDGLDKNILQFQTFIELSSKLLKHGRLIISTNRSINLTLFNDYHSKEISGLSIQSTFLLLKNYLGDQVTDDTATKVHSITSGHPYLLKLVVTLAKSIPLINLLNEFNDIPHAQVETFVKNKIFNNLTEIQKTFLISISFLKIPFRLTALNFFKSDEYKLANQEFMELLAKFLVGKLEFSHHYFLHDLILFYARTLISKAQISDLNVKAFEYLGSLKGKHVLMEARELVFYGLAANRIEETRKHAFEFLTDLMTRGLFSVALDFANSLEQNDVAKQWSFIYYMQGRIHRFREDYQMAILAYDKGTRYSDDKKMAEINQFEKASCLVHHLDAKLEHNKYLEVKDTLKRLEIESEPVQIQALSTLGLLTARYESFDLGLEILKQALEKAKSLQQPSNQIASAFQCLGEIYYRSGNYEKAAEYFIEAFNEYDKVKERLGMNMIDGLHELYEAYGWTLNRLKEYPASAQMFRLAATLSNTFGLTIKYQKSLFYYGYQIMLTGEFKEASSILTDHYEFIKKNNLLDKVDLIREHGVLMVAHWYSGDFFNAIALLGVYIITCFQQGKDPNFFVVTPKDLIPGTKIIDAFQFHCYPLILPDGKKHEDFLEWVQKVIQQRPELEDVLSKLGIMTTEQYKKFAPNS